MTNNKLVFVKLSEISSKVKELFPETKMDTVVQIPQLPDGYYDWSQLLSNQNVKYSQKIVIYSNGEKHLITSVLNLDGKLLITHENYAVIKEIYKL